MNDSESRYHSYLSRLRELETENRRRHIPAHAVGKGCVDLCSNDYMGLGALSAEIPKPCGAWTSSASRLLALDQNAYNAFENRLSILYGKPALTFNSGYHANTGIVSALNLPGTLFVVDRLVHASMIDGLAAGRCKFVRFPHNDMTALECILQKEADNYRQIVILVESIYSMDGDKAPLKELVNLRNRYNDIILYVDEAHGFGVRGDCGLGLCEELGIIDNIDIILCTLGKAAASAGAFCIADRIIIEYLQNTARSFIFSTALPPVIMDRSLQMVNRLVDMKEKRIHLQKISRLFRTRLNLDDNDTPIVPLITSSANKAVELSRKLSLNGIIALPIRRPTVPPGGERIRFSLNANLSDEDICRITDTINNLRNS